MQPAERAVPLPEGVSFEAGACLGVPAITAHYAPFVAGDYSIADMAIWPWASRFEWQTIDLKDFPNVLRWYREIAARPAVQKGYHIPVRQPEIPMP